MLLGLIAVPSAAPAASYKVGISDQNPSTFANPLFAPLKLGMARYVTPWDVMSSSVYSSTLNDWITQAVAGHQRILIAFQASRVPGKQRKAPSVAAYTKAIKAFHSKYPFVKDVQPWNEVNRCQETNAAGFVVGEPICHNPKRAAQYYMAARKVFKGAKITGLDILDQANVKPAVRYVKKFLKYAKPKPKFWGFHNYSDTNRFDTKRTKALLKATKSGDVWLTETGGIVALGSSFPYSTKRAAKALGCMFTLAKSNKRITRLYVYQFFGIPKSSAKLFDAGLINPNNTKRPGYDVVRKRKAGRCHK
ncbi:MAG: hypothetical protein ACJ762_18630 [Solirubrobacteraceae bacterium]